MSYKIVLTGGGTCGHIMPNIALLPELSQHFESIIYIGERNSMEERTAKAHNLTFYSVPSIKLERRKIWRNLAIPRVLSDSVKKTVEILNLLKPNVVFSKGGYVSLPACLAAKQLNIPVVVHESDSSIGVANRLVAKFAKTIITSHESTPRPDSRYVLIGNPIRGELLNGNKTKLIKELKIRPNTPNILVFGGSLGAKAINDLVSESLYDILKKYNVLHIVGNNTNIENILIKGYYPVHFADNIGDYYAAADLIISRAGASAITEISALGKRVIYIPLPKGNSRGDQVKNAAILEKAETALVLNQETATKEKLLEIIDKAMKSPAPPPSYSQDTPKRIVETIIACIK